MIQIKPYDPHFVLMNRKQATTNDRCPGKIWGRKSKLSDWETGRASSQFGRKLTRIYLFMAWALSAFFSLPQGSEIRHTFFRLLLLVNAMCEESVRQSKPERSEGLGCEKLENWYWSQQNNPCQIIRAIWGPYWLCISKISMIYSGVENYKQ